MRWACTQTCTSPRVDVGLSADTLNVITHGLAGIAVVNENSVLLHCNLRFAATLQYPKEDLQHTQLLFYVDLCDREKFTAAWHAAKHSGFAEVQVTLYTSTSQKTSQNVQFFALNTRHRYCVQMHTLDTLSPAQTLVDGYWEWNIGLGTQSYDAQYWRLLGYSVESKREETRPEAWRELIHAEDLSRVEEELKKHLNSQGQYPFRIEARFVHAQGHTVWILSKGNVVAWDIKGAPLRMIGCHIDISQQKQRETEMKFHMACKHRFFSRYSHELRTAMNGIFGSIALLRDMDTLPSRMKALIDTMEGSSNVLLASLNDMLDLSKMTAGKFVLNPTSVDVVRVVQDVVLPYTSGVHPAEITVQTPRADFPAYIYLDEVRFRQIVSNLVSNAMKYTPAGGTVEVGVSCITKSQGCRRCTVLALQVTDTGIGISAAEQRYLFQEYQQVYDAEKVSPLVSVSSEQGRANRGTGLGLSIVHSLVNCMGGEINVESFQGKGSTFTVQLPTRVSPPPPMSRPRTLSASLVQDMRVLVVDDNKVNLHVAAQSLRFLDTRVRTCLTGQECVQLVAQDPNRVDVIFLDCHMPIMNGFETAKQIHRLSGIKHIFIVALTADHTERTRRKCYAAGMHEYVTKPITKRTFVHMLHRARLHRITQQSNNDSLARQINKTTSAK